MCLTMRHMVRDSHGLYPPAQPSVAAVCFCYAMPIILRNSSGVATSRPSLWQMRTGRESSCLICKAHFPRILAKWKPTRSPHALGSRLITATR